MANLKKIFLHVGMHKTGTTAIQSAFSGFDDGNTKYADLEFANHSIPFYTAYSNQHQNYHIWRAAGLGPEAIEAKRKSCRALIENTVRSCNGNLVFSGEDISVIPLSGLLEIRDLFKRNNFTTSVILYAREPVSYMQSALQEDIKGGVFESSIQKSMYRARFEKFITVFGLDSIVARPFDRNTLHGHNIVADFAHTLGVSPPRQQGEGNVALSTAAIKVKYVSDGFVRHFGESRALHAAKQRMIGHLRVLFPGEFAVPEHLIAGGIDQADVEWLFSMLNIDFRWKGHDISKIRDGELIAFLSDLDDATLSVLHAYLVNTVGLVSPPTDTRFLIARYCMSFMEIR
jgi:hypothetical protein